MQFQDHTEIHFSRKSYVLEVSTQDEFSTERSWQDMRWNNIYSSKNQRESTKAVPVGHTTYRILQQMRKYASENNYNVIETYSNELLLVQQSCGLRLRRFFRCFCKQKEPRRLRFRIQTDEYLTIRVLILQDLTKDLDSSHVVSRQYILESICKQFIPILEQQEDKDDIMTLKVTSNYMYGKMLLQHNYSLGKKMEQFQAYEMPPNVDYEDIVWIQGLKSELVEDLLKDFNCSRKQLTQILCFCGMAIENYLYAKIVPELTFDGNRKSSKYPLTFNQFLKLRNILAPMLFDRQIYLVLSTFEYEYSKRDLTAEMMLPVRNRKEFELSEVIKEAQLANLKQRLEIQDLYHKANSQPLFYKNFKAAVEFADDGNILADRSF